MRLSPLGGLPMFLTAGPLVEHMPTRVGAAGALIAQNVLHNLAVVQEKDAQSGLL